jgi:CHAT domain-containing protein
LKPGEAALEIVRITVPSKNGNILVKSNSDSVAYAIMILQHGRPDINYFLVENGKSLETKYISFYRNAMMGQIEDRYSYDKFWLPIKKNLRGVSRVYLSADGVYNQINLNALKNPSTNQYVLDEIDLRYITNTADLLRESSSKDIVQAVLVGRPSYTIDVTAENLPDAGETDGYGLRNLLSEELAGFREQSFADLPGTEKEIVMIRQTLERQLINVTTLKGNEATEENVKHVISPGILHIATHGFFVEDSANVINPMIRSGVILAGVRNTERSSSEDGILTAYEATHLNLDETELVVLSACETGLGEVRNGEGVYGLQRAIIVAGSNNLLMSLWKVDDAATAELMSNLYSGLKGKTSVEAFRDAQVKLRGKYPHPFYWGAFIMLGK